MIDCRDLPWSLYKAKTIHGGVKTSLLAPLLGMILSSFVVYHHFPNTGNLAVPLEGG